MHRNSTGFKTKCKIFICSFSAGRSDPGFALLHLPRMGYGLMHTQRIQRKLSCFIFSFLVKCSYSHHKKNKHSLLPCFDPGHEHLACLQSKQQLTCARSPKLVQSLGFFLRTSTATFSSPISQRLHTLKCGKGLSLKTVRGCAYSFMRVSSLLLRSGGGCTKTCQSKCVL